MLKLETLHISSSTGVFQESEPDKTVLNEGGLHGQYLLFKTLVSMEKKERKTRKEKNHPDEDRTHV